METKTTEFEKRANGAYLRFGPLARKYYYTFKRSSVTRGYAFLSSAMSA